MVAGRANIASLMKAPPRSVGRYELLETLGRGTTSVVFKARDPVLSRVVVLKMVDLAALPGPERDEFVSRFRGQAGLAAPAAEKGPATTAFENPKFSFSFTYDAAREVPIRGRREPLKIRTWPQ